MQSSAFGHRMVTMEKLKIYLSVITDEELLNFH